MTTANVLNSGATGALILILPIAVAVAIAYAAWSVLLGAIAIGIIWQLWQQYRWQRWRRQLDPDFLALVREHHGCITPVDLSVRANLTLEAARRFLEKQARIYGARRKDFADKGSVYYFLTTGALEGLFTDLEAPTGAEEGELATESPAPEILASSLAQAELAQRLRVHPSTVAKRKVEPDFAIWSRKRDPEGLAWQYFPQDKVFNPVP